MAKHARTFLPGGCLLGWLKSTLIIFSQMITLKIARLILLNKFYPKTVSQCVTANNIVFILLDGKGQSK
jgi:hypothetical protein